MTYYWTYSAEPGEAGIEAAAEAAAARLQLDISVSADGQDFTVSIYTDEEGNVCAFQNRMTRRGFYGFRAGRN
tara:strand:- start:1030 stop:1248 length:219 start_codon:yes stop_codon:yes gene_type:complete